MNEIPGPPSNHRSKDSTYVPPHRNRDQQVRQVNFPNVTEGALLDSGASAHVSGNSTLFVATKKLTTPHTFYLAIPDCHVSVVDVGRVTIPTPTGNLVIEDVYHVPGVEGIILLTGRLLAEGWKLVYRGTEATLFYPSNNSYSTIFHNYCWSLKTIPPEMKLSKVTQIPSFEPYIWHVRLGHASEEVVRAYMKRHYPEDKFKWSSFFSLASNPDKNEDSSAPEFTGKNHQGSDDAAEYVHPLRRRLAAVGISLAPSAPYCPQQNGEAERLNRTINDMARTMLHESMLPHRFWGYAWSTAAHMHNRLPNSRTAGKVPLELLFNVKPNPDLEERAQEAQLIGYPESGAGWLFFAPAEKRAIHSTAAKFPDFQELPVKNVSGKSDLDFILKQIMLKLGEEETDVIAAEEKQQLKSLEVGPEIDLPKNIKTALAGVNSVEWREAAGYEMKKFEELDVWVAVDLFKGMKVLGGRWVFSIKRKVDGTIDKFRARYVAKGFNQQLGIDCNETYALTALLNTLRLLISIAHKFNFLTATFDVSSAYLYSPIEEDVYVQPPVEIFPHLKGKVMRLKKALYGTKRAARCWWKFFKKTVEGLGFTASEIEPLLYLFKKGEGFCWDTNSGDPNTTHKVKRRRGSKPAAARVTTAAIPNLRLLSPQSLLDRITDNTIDQSTHAVDSGLNEQSLLQGDGEPNTVTQERLI
ncbi:hypothetical protein MJO28_010762 [Puccinia striiformis f. sp. tritici]|uniref:Uncharacterized protein n=1 Tax=Puccinia striiformis f. sp. tritici TaxID=168172 RepID=A0ACC0E5V1_9BASI|nr:hypothetical protein MJO28_010762 [Puccinia striiformis f. sp. tritici]